MYIKYDSQQIGFVCLFVAVDFLLPAQQQLLGLSHHVGRCLHLYLHSYKTKHDSVKGREIWAMCVKNNNKHQSYFFSRKSHFLKRSRV